jgi:hypothetical protein
MHSFDREVCRRLPLADAVFRLLDFALDDDFLHGVFDRYRGRCYQDTLTFPCFVQLIADALLGQERSAHRHFQHAQDQGTLPTGVEAVYGKLRRIPLPLSQGLLAEATARLRQVFPDSHDPLPASLDAFEVYAFDGKKIKHVAKRLKALWRLNGQVLGGKLLVVQHVTTGLAVALAADADGEADERPLVATALAQVRQQDGDKPRLWIGDRLFCDRHQLPSLQEGGDHYLVRHHARFHFHVDPTQSAQTGVDGRGVPYTQEWGWLGAADQPQRQKVRRITLHRNAAETLAVVTDLLDETTCPATDLLEAYLRRWGIEKLFQRVTEVFDLRHLIGTAPPATVFQAAFLVGREVVLFILRILVFRDQFHHKTKHSNLLVTQSTRFLHRSCPLLSNLFVNLLQEVFRDNVPEVGVVHVFRENVLVLLHAIDKQPFERLDEDVSEVFERIRGRRVAERYVGQGLFAQLVKE